MKSLNDLTIAEWIMKYEQILTFVKEKHKDQIRRNDNEPYFIHLVEVSDLISLVVYDRDLIAAGLLHDVIEDVKGVKKEDVVELAGEATGKYVEEATNVSKKRGGNRAFRREADALRLLSISEKGKTLKLADCIHNLSTVPVDEDFCKLYYSEKRNLLLSLYGGDKILFKALVNILTHYYKTGTIYDYETTKEFIRLEGIFNWAKRK